MKLLLWLAVIPIQSCLAFSPVALHRTRSRCPSSSPRPPSPRPLSASGASDAASGSPDPPDVLALTHTFLREGTGYFSAPDATWLADDFVFRAPTVGPLNKADYLATMTTLGVCVRTEWRMLRGAPSKWREEPEYVDARCCCRTAERELVSRPQATKSEGSPATVVTRYRAFPDIAPNAFGLAVDPSNPLRVRLWVRTSGTHTAPWQPWGALPPVPLQPTGAQLRFPTEVQGGTGDRGAPLAMKEEDYDVRTGRTATTTITSSNGTRLAAASTVAAACTAAAAACTAAGPWRGASRPRSTTAKSLSIVFAPDGRVRHFAAGYVVNAFEGNTGGRGAVLGLFTAIGAAPIGDLALSRHARLFGLALVFFLL